MSLFSVYYIAENPSTPVAREPPSLASPRRSRAPVVRVTTGERRGQAQICTLTSDSK